MVLLQRFYEKRSEIIVISRIHGVTAHAGIRHHDPAGAAGHQPDLLLQRQRVEIGLVEGLGHAVVGELFFYLEDLGHQGIYVRGSHY
jgi:hypothetical protein